MVWIQVWTDPHEFIRSEKIESVFYRSLKKGQDDDWIEVVALPMNKVIFQLSVNTGNRPRAESELKTWQRLVNSRAHLAIEEVVQILSDKEHRAKIVSLKDLIHLNFEQEAPRSLDMEVWVWEVPCNSCHNDTPVVYPVGAFFGYMLEFNFLSNLPLLLAEKYPFFRKTAGEGNDAGEYHNTCVHCGASQPDWRVMESYLELANNPSTVKEKSRLTVPLTEKEKEEYKKAGIDSDW